MTEAHAALYNHSGGDPSPPNLDNGIYRADTSLTLTVEQLANQLHISRATAYALVRTKSFYPAFRIGNRWIVSVPALTRWLDDQTRGKIVT